MGMENRELRAERGRIANEMQTLLDNPGGLHRPEDREKFERLDAEQKRLKSLIDQLEHADEVYRETRYTGRPPLGEVGTGIMSPTEKEDREYKAAFGRYLRRGRGELSVEDRAMLRMETRDMGTGGGAAYPGDSAGSGSFFVPVGFVNAVERALKYYGPMLDEDVVTIMPTENGQPMPYPTSNDTAVIAELVGENQQVTTADITLGMVMFGAWKFSTKMVKVSLELLEDSAFDLEAFLVKQFAERLGRGLNQFLSTGTGVSQPTGILSAVAASGPSTTAVGAYSNDGVSGANTIGSDDLTALEHSIDPLYRPGAKYMMSDSVLKSIKLVKDKYGRPLWMPSVREGTPDLVNGYAYVINNNMAGLQTHASSPTVTNTTMLFGRLDKYVVRRVKQMSVLRLSERFADYGQVAFLGFARYDGNLLDAGTHPIGQLVNAY